MIKRSRRRRAGVTLRREPTQVRTEIDVAPEHDVDPNTSLEDREVYREYADQFDSPESELVYQGIGVGIDLDYFLMNPRR
jgi:hypothetical protein